jgi:hypothetical protein
MLDGDTWADVQMPAAELIMHQGPWPGQRFPVTQPTITIGRQEGNDVAVDEPRLSRHHATLAWDGKRWIVEDLGSANGTYVNGVRLIAPQALHDGDIVGLGPGVQLAFRAGPSGVRPSVDPDATLAGSVPGPRDALRRGPPLVPRGTPSKAPPAMPAPADKRGWQQVGVPLLAAALVFGCLLVAALAAYFLWSREGGQPAVSVATPNQGELAETLVLPTAERLQPGPTLARESLPSGESAPGLLIQPEDLVYLGAFRLPDRAPGGEPDIGWGWGGGAMTYYPQGDPNGPDDGFPGSLFGTGHDWNTYVSEINIPVPVISPGKNLEELNTATTLQEFRDIKGNLFGYLEIPRVGLEYLPAQGAQTHGKLYFAWAQHMGEGETNPSHGWSELDLSNPGIAGAWRIDDFWNYVTGDYIFAIPGAWAEANTPGMYLATGRFRDGGQGAEGPSLFAYGPWNDGNPPAQGATLSAIPLLLYGNVYEENPPAMNGYHHSDEWSGGAWLTAGDRSAVIFVGTKGQGECWYGFANGVVWPDDPPYPPVPDPPFDDRGWWSDRFVGQILFYDPAHLAAVARGNMAASEPQPYATLEIDPYLYHIESSQQWRHLGAAGFDRERGRLYIFELFGDGDKPLVHVWGQ